MVRQARLACLSMSKDEECFHSAKAFKGDGVTLFFEDVASVSGIIKVVTDHDVRFTDGRQYKLKDIKCFNIYTRGNYSRSVFNY